MDDFSEKCCKLLLKMIKYDKCQGLKIHLEVENLNTKFKSLRSGKAKTEIPQFQPIKKQKVVNDGDKKDNKEHTNKEKENNES